MGNYIKYFQKIADYETFKGGKDFVTPNVSFVKENQTLYYTDTNNITIATVAENNN